MKRLAIVIIAALAASGNVFGQDKVEVAYSIGFGTGDIGDFISNTSFRGISFDYRHHIDPNIAIGAHVGWNTFYAEEPYQTYTIDNESLTGRQYRYSNNFSMLATGSYFFKPHETISPFAGLGVGTVYTRRNTDMNLYTVEQDAWNFALQPEAGVYFQTADLVAIVVSLKYMHGFQAGELDTDQSYLSINIGLAFF